MKKVKKRATKKPERNTKMSNELVTNPTTPQVITPLKDLVEAYLEADKQIKVFDEAYEANTKDLKTAKDQIRAEIQKTIKERGEYSARLDKATVTLSVRKTAVIVDEALLVKDLKKQKLTDYYQTRATDLFKDTVLKEVAKGEKTFKGLEIREVEFISIRSNSDKPDARRIVTEKFVPLK